MSAPDRNLPHPDEVAEQHAARGALAAALAGYMEQLVGAGFSRTEALQIVIGWQAVVLAEAEG